MKRIFFTLFAFISLSVFAQETSKQYDKIGGFDNGVAIVWKGGKCGLINASGKEIIKPEYDKISSFGRDGIAYTHKGGLVGLINIEGKVLAPNIYTSISSFRDFHAVTRKNGLCGVINKAGKVLVENEYNEIKLERYGVARGIKNGKEVLLELKD